MPLNLYCDDQGDLWGIGEFNQHFYHLKNAAKSDEKQLENILFPRINPRPFLLPLRGKISPSFSSQFGEKVLLTKNDKGRVVWFSRGGAYCIPYYESEDYRPIEEWGHDANFSEIVAYYPDQQPAYFEVYRLPKGWSNVSGLHWDEKKQELWFLEFSHDNNQPHISVLRPYDFNFRRGTNTPLMHQAKPSAWEHFSIPAEFHSVAHLCEDDEGCFWFSGYLSNNIGCYNPFTKRFYCLPLPRSSVGHHKGKGPWDVHYYKKAGREYLFFSEFYDASVSVIDLSTVKDFFETNKTADCFPSGEINNVYKERRFSSPCLESVNEVHSLCFDAHGDLWFTTSNIEKNISTGIVACLELSAVKADYFLEWHELSLKPFKIMEKNNGSDGIKKEELEANSAFTGLTTTGQGEELCIIVADQFAKKLRRFYPNKNQ